MLEAGPKSFIRVNGNSTTTAEIPFAQGVTIADHATMEFLTEGFVKADSNGDLSVDNGVGAVFSLTTDEDSTSSTSEYDIFDEDNYGGTLTKTDNITADGVSYAPSTGRITVTNAGTYLINVSLIVNSSSSSLVTVKIKVNGSAVYDHDVYCHSSVDPVERTFTILKSLSASDYINVTIENITSSNTSQAMDGTTINIVRMSPSADGTSEEARRMEVDTTYFVADDFIGAQTAKGYVNSQVYWKKYYDATVMVYAYTAEADHPGIFHIQTAATNNSGTVLTMNDSADCIVGAAGDTFRAWIKVGATGAGRTVRVGFADQTDFTTPTEGFYFEYNGDSSANWKIISVSTSSSSTTTSTAATNGWVELRGVMNSSSEVEFFIDGTSVGTQTTNIPSGSQYSPYIYWRNGALSATAKDLYIDYYEAYNTSITR